MPLSATKSIYQKKINSVVSSMIYYFQPSPLQSDEPVDDTVTFMDNHVPAIKEGTYTLDVTQTTNQNSSVSIKPINEQRFRINGPQYRINPQDVLSVFPPASSTGDHAYVLPHIAFKRSSLPWEVNRANLPWDTSDNNANQETDPWLALLLFTDTKIPDVKTETLGDLGLADTFNPATEQVNTIELDQSLISDIAPSANDLKFLTHVRQKIYQNGNIEKAFVVGNRLPKTNTTSVVHLVSLANFPTAAAGKVKFISLYHWKFSCVEDKPGFKDILTKVDARAFRLYKTVTPPTNNDPYSIENKYYVKGYVPMPHFLRKGEQTLSWYRGPFLPDKSALSVPPYNNDFVAYSADNYLQFDSAGSNMLNVSYAAAWQLGRMLTLQNKDVALAIQAYKQQVTQFIKANDLNKSNYLTFLQSNTQSPNQQQIVLCAKAIEQNPGTHPEVCANIKFNPIVIKWLEQLTSLGPVPFNYLVPNDSMLPRESVRFFALDYDWIIFLLEGALSIGTEKFNLPTPKFVANKDYCGFLLRSEVVGDYPDMHIAAYAKTPADAKLENADAEYPSGNAIRPIIQRKLSEEVLLCIFESSIATVDLYMKKEALHMGFDYENKQIEKSVRDATTGVELPNQLALTTDATTGVVSDNNNQNVIINENRILNLANLKLAINNALSTAGKTETINTSHAFTLQMMEGVPKVRVVRKNT